MFGWIFSPLSFPARGQSERRGGKERKKKRKKRERKRERERERERDPGATGNVRVHA